MFLSFYRSFAHIPSCSCDAIRTNEHRNVKCIAHSIESTTDKLNVWSGFALSSSSSSSTASSFFSPFHFLLQCDVVRMWVCITISVYKFWGWNTHSVAYLWFSSYRIRHGPTHTRTNYKCWSERVRVRNDENRRNTECCGAVWEIIVCIANCVWYALDRHQNQSVATQPKIAYCEFCQMHSQLKCSRPTEYDMGFDVAAEEYDFLFFSLSIVTRWASLSVHTQTHPRKIITTTDVHSSYDCGSANMNFAWTI